MYRCGNCGLGKIKVKASARHPNEDIIHWMQRAMEACGADHLIRSPVCGTDKLDLYIPMPPGDKNIGEAELGREATAEEKEAWEKAIKGS